MALQEAEAVAKEAGSMLPLPSLFGRTVECGGTTKGRGCRERDGHCAAFAVSLITDFNGLFWPATE